MMFSPVFLTFLRYLPSPGYVAPLLQAVAGGIRKWYNIQKELP
jgi:hypothetical protein